MPAHIPRTGETAPDFELPNQFGEPVRLSKLRGRITVVVFYPFAFSGVCTGELCELRDNLDAFTAKDAHVLAVSVDAKYALRAYAQSEGYDFDLLSDFWPHGDVARSYGVFNETRGMAERGTFIIDDGGIVRYSVVNPVGEARSLAEYRKALDELA
ncbi:peroxiredoxin [Arthrobacter sp. H14]|uniref:peroxiredoxin n=1 Tax=Arthrobacter sp. H14 TaxID=1312959 RepID=UPI00047C7EFE|nr:peroxiredoxin [Arthrobacter sp. H14]